jgi:hypothetical protein
MINPKWAAAGRGLVGGEGQQLLGNTPLARPGFMKQNERQRKGRDGAARRLGAGRLTARRRHSRGCERMGASISSAHMRAILTKLKRSKGRGFYPLSPVAHDGSAMVELGLAFTAAEGNKRPRLAASKGACLDGGRISRGTLKAPPLPCAHVCTKATAR